MEAVGRFESGGKNREIAAALRVSERSVELWRRQRRERGEAGVRSKHRPDPDQLTRSGRHLTFKFSSNGA
ncbi:helix-turn-helix domain-containing protein [Streptomyces sp. NPDC005780]|uniref:helix-turn-helix domain-containing protein n=1 Tax=Streptomyces sp. NPDC005780 TaxID=3364730 RepID=UPI0036C2EF7D